MARMIGKLQVKDWCGYGCCTTEKSKKTIVRQELGLAFKEAEHEMTDWPHENGICYQPNGIGYGCDLCYNDPDDAYDNSDLDEIPGVWCNKDWRSAYAEWELELLGIPQPRKAPLG